MRENQEIGERNRAITKRLALVSIPGCVALDYDLDVPQFAAAVVQVRNYILLVGDKMIQIQFYGVAPPLEDLRATRQEMMEHVIRSIKKI